MKLQSFLPKGWVVNIFLVSSAVLIWINCGRPKPDPLIELQKLENEKGSAAAQEFCLVLLKQFPQNLPIQSYLLHLRKKQLMTLVAQQETPEQWVIDSLMKIGKQLDDLSQKDSQNVFVLDKAAGFYLDLGHLERAEELYQKILRLDTLNFVAYKNLSLIYFNWQKNDLAYQNIRRALKIQPQDPEVLQISETIYQNYENYLLSEVDQHPRQIIPLFKLAQFHVQNGNEDTGLETLQKILTFNKNHIPSLRMAAKIFQNKHQYWESLKYYLGADSLQILAQGKRGPS